MSVRNRLTCSGVSWGCNGDVWTMAEGAGGVIYLGGEFSVCDDVAANNIVAYEPATNQFSVLGEGPSNGVNSTVQAIEVVGEQVFVGGRFSTAGGVSANRVALWDGDAWQAIGDNAFISGTVFALHWNDASLYIGGFFTQIGSGNDALAANRIAVWENGQWATLAGGVNGTVRAITTWDGLVFLGGDFSAADGAPASHVVAWDGQVFLPLTGPEGEGVASQFGTIVFDLLPGQDGLLVAGQFNLAGGRSINNIAFWNGNDWFPLGTEEQNGTNSSVTSITYLGDEVLVTGSFSAASGTLARRLGQL